MSDSLRLTLFPLYPGGRVIHVPVGDANRSFYLPETAFTPSYAVNIPPQQVPDGNFSIDNGRLVQGTGTTLNANRLLALDGLSLRQTSEPESAPEIPDIYQRQASFLTITDEHYDDLITESEFRIPGIGLGLKVTTDGLGGIDSVAIDPGSRGVLPPVSAIAENFLGANRAEISMGAAFFHTSPPFGPSPPEQQTAQTGVSRAASQPSANPFSIPGESPALLPLNPQPERLPGSGFPLEGEFNTLSLPELRFPLRLSARQDSPADFNRAASTSATEPTIPENSTHGEISADSFAQTAEQTEHRSGNPFTAVPLRMDRLMDGRIQPPMPPFTNPPIRGSLPLEQNGFELASELNASLLANQSGIPGFFRMETGLPRQEAPERRLQGGLSGEGESGREQPPFGSSGNPFRPRR